MDIISIIIYTVLLLLVSGYVGVIVYHIIRYRVELPPPQLRYVTSAMILYLTVVVIVLVGSIIIAIFI